MIHGFGSEQAFCLAREQRGRGGPHATHHRVRPRIVLTAQASRQTSSRRSVPSSLAESGTGEDKAGPVGREWKSVRNSARNSSLTGSVAAPERPFSRAACSGSDLAGAQKPAGGHEAVQQGVRRKDY